MNPRRAFMATMGWCPGVEAAARMFPDREVSNRKIVIFGAAIFFLISTYSGYYYFAFPAETRLRVTITEGNSVQTFYDDEFNDSFNYARLIKSDVYVAFNQPQNASDSVSVKVTEKLNVTTLRDVYSFMRGLAIPKVVAGVADAMLNRTYDQVNEIMYPGQPSSAAGMGIEKDLGYGRGLGGGVFYSIDRERSGLVHDGIVVTKYFGPVADSGARSFYWVLEVDSWPVSGSPFYEIRLTRYP